MNEWCAHINDILVIYLSQPQRYNLTKQEIEWKMNVMKNEKCEDEKNYTPLYIFFF